MKGRHTLRVQTQAQPDVQPIVSEYEFLVEQMRQGVWRLDATGLIIEVNRHMARWLGGKPTDIVGRNVADFLAHDVDMIRDEMFETEFRTIDGISRVGVVSSRALRHEGGMLLGALQVVTDVTSNRAMQSRLVSEIQKMARLAGEDPLTGLPNRRAFDLVLQDSVASAAREPFGLLMLDLNDFKPINDQYGHQVGDVALTTFAKKLEYLLRDTDFVARIGGDEFAIIFSNAEKPACEQAVIRLDEGLRFDFEHLGGKTAMSCAIGMAHSSDGAEMIVERADAEMYSRKRKLGV
ncbi:MAG: sensor domain-containing diguanylate cyclase [Armatimonadetes bacterium]|nr:sensor domain-containing diguanylate cyclase [Armatimonadota bacterium]